MRAAYPIGNGPLWTPAFSGEGRPGRRNLSARCGFFRARELRARARGRVLAAPAQGRAVHPDPVPAVTMGRAVTTFPLVRRAAVLGRTIVFGDRLPPWPL